MEAAKSMKTPSLVENEFTRCNCVHVLREAVTQKLLTKKMVAAFQSFQLKRANILCLSLLALFFKSVASVTSFKYINKQLLTAFIKALRA
jgi:hypothetical protein